MQRRHLFLATAVATLAACGGPPDGFTTPEWTAIQQLGPLPAVPADPTNKYADNLAAAQLGRQIFFDKRYSGAIVTADDGTNGGLGQVGETGKVACADCHLPETHYMDSRSIPNNVSLGANWAKRNAPSLVNVGHYSWYTWAGKMDSLWTQGANSPESPDLASNRCAVAHFLWNNYHSDYDAIFDDPLPAALDPLAVDASRFPAACKPKPPGGTDGAWEAMEVTDQVAIMRIMSNVGKAIAAYERKLVSGPTALDRYIGGETDALSSAQKRGLKLFVGKAFCIDCHEDALLSDGEFHNLGIPQTGLHVPATDSGRYADLPLALANAYSSAGQFSDDQAAGQAKVQGLAATAADLGAFRTSGLRGIAESAPYSHDGVFATLEEVVDFYDQGGGDANFVGTKDAKMKALNLTDAEKADLVAFLHALSGAEPPAEWGRP